MGHMQMQSCHRLATPALEQGPGALEKASKRSLTEGCGMIESWVFTKAAVQEDLEIVGRKPEVLLEG